MKTNWQTIQWAQPIQPRRRLLKNVCDVAIVFAYCDLTHPVYFALRLRRLQPTSKASAMVAAIVKRTSDET